MGLDGMSAQEVIDKAWAQGNGTYDNQGNRTGDENKGDCCPGPDYGTIVLASKAIGLDMNTQSKVFYSDSEEAVEMHKTRATEAILFYVGGKAFQLAFRGGRWVWLAYKSGQAAKGTSVLVNSLKAIDKADELLLHRDLTGSEGSGTAIFFSDNAAVAATYIKNGGSVVEVAVSKVQVQKMIWSKQVQTLRGIHGPTGIISTEYKFLGSELRQAVMSLTK